VSLRLCEEAVNTVERAGDYVVQVVSAFCASRWSRDYRFWQHCWVWVGGSRRIASNRVNCGSISSEGGDFAWVICAMVTVRLEELCRELVKLSAELVKLRTKSMGLGVGIIPPSDPCGDDGGVRFYHSVGG